MDLRTLTGLTVGDSLNSAVKAAEDRVEKNLDLIIGLFLARLQSDTDGDAFKLETVTTEMLKHLQDGNSLFTPQTTPAPAGALPAGTTSSASSNEEAERIGTEALAIVGGDVSKANGLLSMLEKIVASGPEATVLAGYLFNGLTGDEIKAAGPHLGDFVITNVKNVAANKDEIVSRGLTAELKSAVEQSRVNGALNAQLQDLLHKLGVTKVADAQTAIDNLKNNGTNAVNLANQARTYDLDKISAALGLNRNGDTDDKFASKIEAEAKKAKIAADTLTDQVRRSAAIARLNGISTIAANATPVEIWTAIVAHQENNAGTGLFSGGREEIRLS